MTAHAEEGCAPPLRPRLIQRTCPDHTCREGGVMLRLRRWILALCAGCLLCAAQRGLADPPARADAVLDETALAARIDQLITERLADKGVTPAPLADDAEFLRRVYLD